MRRYKTFAFRVNEDDNKMIVMLADYYRRSRSDMVRMLIHECATFISKDKKTKIGKNHNSTPTGVIHEKTTAKN